MLGWHYATTLWHFYLIGFLLGIAGASFAVALPLAGRWYPAEHQGLAMGIAGAGNSGTLMATFFGPRLAQQFGWHFVFALALVPVAMVLIAFFLLAKNSPSKTKAKNWSQYAKLLGQGDTWSFCYLYSLTFGGFVGLASFLSVFFHDQYHLTKVQAGDFTTVVVLAGSFLRPVGGWLSDKIGGYRLLLGLFTLVAISLVAISSLPPIAVVVPVLFLVMGLLGMGNGAVFQMAPQRFPADIELLTGIVGAAGGLGGFFLPSLLGALKTASAAMERDCSALAGLITVTVFMLLEFGVRWQAVWTPAALSRAQIFAYRKPAPQTLLPGALVTEGDAAGD